MLATLENLEPKRAEKVLAALMKTLLPDATARSEEHQLQSLTPVEREILQEVSKRLSLAGPLPSKDEVPSVLEILSRELSEFVLSKANPQELQARTFDKDVSTQESVVRRRKPTVFISSSPEGLEHARALQRLLESYAVTELWGEHFAASETVLESLMRSVARFDFATFLLTNDDISSFRGRAGSTSRENVAFEVGLFVGRLGPNRIFFVLPKDQHGSGFLSDLAGLVALTYNPFATATEASFGHVSHWIVNQIQRLGPIESKAPAQSTFSPDGRAFATLSAGRIQIWDANSGQLVMTLGGLD